MRDPVYSLYGSGRICSHLSPCFRDPLSQCSNWAVRFGIGRVRWGLHGIPEHWSGEAARFDNYYLQTGAVQSQSPLISGKSGSTNLDIPSRIEFFGQCCTHAIQCCGGPVSWCLNARYEVCLLHCSPYLEPQ